MSAKAKLNYFHPLSLGMMFSTAKGSYIYTQKGKKILDFTGGFGVLDHGHNHDRILNVRKDFQNKLQSRSSQKFFMSLFSYFKS